MSKTQTRTDALQLDARHGAADALVTAVKHQLQRHEQTLTRLRSTNAPLCEIDRVMARAHALKQFLTDINNPRENGGIPTVEHAAKQPDLLREQLASLYVELSPQSHDDANAAIEDAGLEEVARRLAGWGHRAR